MKRPFMQEDQKGHKLLSILDLLTETEGALTVNQIQYRLGRDHNVDMSREEIESHLHWGLLQPNATNAPVRPMYISNTDKWAATAKVRPTLEHIRAAGPLPGQQWYIIMARKKGESNAAHDQFKELATTAAAASRQFRERKPNYIVDSVRLR